MNTYVQLHCLDGPPIVRPVASREIQSLDIPRGLTHYCFYDADHPDGDQVNVKTVVLRGSVLNASADGAWHLLAGEPGQHFAHPKVEVRCPITGNVLTVIDNSDGSVDILRQDHPELDSFRALELALEAELVS